MHAYHATGRSSGLKPLSKGFPRFPVEGAEDAMPPIGTATNFRPLAQNIARRGFIVLNLHSSTHHGESAGYTTPYKTSKDQGKVPANAGAQKPIILQGHERSLTQIVFNAEGDLLFSASKDVGVNVWFTSNGERLGTFNGHNGTVWTLAVDCECRQWE